MPISLAVIESSLPSIEYDFTNILNHEIFGINTLNMVSLTIMSASVLSQSNYLDGIIKIAAFAFAKGAANTIVEIASDNREYICLQSMLKPACEFLGIVENTEIANT